MKLSLKEKRFAERFSRITHNRTYRQLLNVPRHGSTNTYDHCVRVARLCYLLAPFLLVDWRSAARVGFLHDFCMVDYHLDDKETHGGRWYCFYHPEEAIENAEKEGMFLSRLEKKAILSHMFPLATSLPSSRLGCVLVISDKITALQESLANLSWINRKAVSAFSKAGKRLGIPMEGAAKARSAYDRPRERSSRHLRMRVLNRYSIA